VTEALALPLRDDRSQQPAPAAASPRLGGRRIAVVGLGYVGLPTALSLHDAGAAVFGVDIDESRLAAIRARDVDLLGGDVARLQAALAGERLTLSASGAGIGAADAVIVSVPTPVDQGRHPDPRALRGACEAVVAHARPAGKMKHGPIALLAPGTPVIAVATDSPVLDKALSNLQEVRARGAHVIAVAGDGNEEIGEHADDVIRVPSAHWMLAPLLAVIPLQLLAYHIARLRGLNVDQPRNLAKTVTVE
jgi:UDP-glucose/GDP-mannose dehydrogenase family, NAD binding domain/SIS domain